MVSFRLKFFWLLAIWSWCIHSFLQAEMTKELKEQFGNEYRKLVHGEKNTLREILKNVRGGEFYYQQDDLRWFFSPSLPKRVIDFLIKPENKLCYDFLPTYFQKIYVEKIEGGYSPFALLMPFVHLFYDDLLRISPSYKKSSIEKPYYTHDMQRAIIPTEQERIAYDNSVKNDNQKYVDDLTEQYEKAAKYLFERYYIYFANTLEQGEQIKAKEDLEKHAKILQNQCLLVVYMSNTVLIKKMVEKLAELRNVPQLQDILRRIRVASFARQPDNAKDTPLSLAPNFEIQELLMKVGSE